MKFRVLLTIAVLMIGTKVFAQFDAQTAFYMNFESNYNPGAVGDGNLMRAAGSYRLQWLGIKNAPKTGYFSFQSPFVIGKTRHGAGVRFMTDKIGLFDNQTVYLQYAYKFKLGKGYLGVGADFGFASLTFHGDSVSIPQADNTDQLSGDGFTFSQPGEDPAIPTSKESGMGFDMALGVHYYTNTWYAGISYSHLTQPVIDLDDYSSFSVNGTLYMEGGYNWKINKKVALLPSALLKTDFRSWTMDISLLMQIKDRFRPGISYRWGDALGLMFQADIISGLSLGYAYELPMNKIIAASSGSHEVFLSYGFDILGRKNTHKYKSIRIL